MQPDPLWLILNEDGEIDASVNAPNESAAREWARDACGYTSDDDFTVHEVTAADRRAWRNARRRERYAERQDNGWSRPRAKPVSPEARAWYAGLGMMAALSLHDEQGRLRCPTCSRFATLDDFAGAPTSAIGGGICIDFAPECRRCRGIVSAGMDEAAAVAARVELR